VIPARIRIPSYAVWEFAVFVLNVLAFILVGFQLKGILRRIDSHTLAEYSGIAALVLVATIAARIGWVIGASAFSRWWRKRATTAANQLTISRGAAAVVGWCGMRGIVTLAAALALPIEFPYRDLVVFCAFAVVLGTLVVQGLTLRPLMSRLKLEEDDSVAREVRLARVETIKAALQVTNEHREEELSGLLHRRYEVMLRRAEAGLDGGATTDEAEAAITRRVAAAERERLVALRENGTIGDAAFQRIEQELDLEELDQAQLVSRND
jgi:CPA1 family monovalent cation:H+ antiporter